MKKQDDLSIVIPGDYPLQIKGSTHLETLKKHGQITLFDSLPKNIEDQIQRVKNADIILNTRASIKWDSHSIKKLPKLKMIATCGVGLDNIDLVAAKKSNILVSNLPGVNSKYVAEHVIGLMFSLAKRTAYQTTQIKSGNWNTKPNYFISGKTIGLIGTGNIGSKIANLANNLGLNVIAWTFNPSVEKAQSLNLKYVSLQHLIQKSDIISIQVKLTQDSEKMLGEKEFKMMKKNTLFINAARGGLIDNNALVKYLQNGHIGGAALDVFEIEPIPKSHPILKCEQVILTPHNADLIPECMDALNEGAVHSIISFIQGNPVNIANL
ncbi:MAG: 3-phosphoglycerate dehydrogenase [Chloroflexi bacterium]|nr:3-phosphoglycerate dehydrogenase [Chloroflexota bacterium]|tara:strand:- start:128 stop:1099 length:972 start_codon:yes stop_codon:yes gene_type:complete